jgi:hypothetical protein
MTMNVHDAHAQRRHEYWQRRWSVQEIHNRWEADHPDDAEARAFHLSELIRRGPDFSADGDPPLADPNAIDKFRERGRYLGRLSGRAAVLAEARRLFDLAQRPTAETTLLGEPEPAFLGKLAASLAECRDREEIDEERARLRGLVRHKQLSVPAIAAAIQLCLDADRRIAVELTATPAPLAPETPAVLSAVSS